MKSVFLPQKKLEDEFVLVARTVIHLVFVVAFAEITPSGIGARLREIARELVNIYYSKTWRR